MWHLKRSASKTVCILEQNPEAVNGFIQSEKVNPVKQARLSDVLGLIQMRKVSGREHSASTAQLGLPTKLFTDIKGVKDGRRQPAEGKM